MLSGISIVCFASSYAVTLALEVSRLLFRLRVRWLVMILFALAGLLAHTLYLINLARIELTGVLRIPFSSWYDWCLLAAWVLAATYIALAIRRPSTSIGVFLLPLVLLLIGVAVVMRGAAPFERQQALAYWGMIHGFMLLMGTTTVALGFAAGIMYLVQASRLKRKLPPLQGLRLPSLEWLQRLNRRMLIWSTGWLGMGLLAGTVLNLIHQTSGQRTLSWVNPTVMTSLVLFCWLLAATCFESFYKPAREGHKVAYVTLASFVFLGLVLAAVLLTHHGSAVPGASNGPLPTQPAFDQGDSPTEPLVDP